MRRSLDEAVEDGGEPLEAAKEAGLGDGFFLAGTLGAEDVPAGGVQPGVGGDFAAVPAVADLGVADQEIRDLHGGNDAGVARGGFGAVMIAGGFDQELG